ncbi:WAS/WASL-interacting protein family member 3-like [Aquila chrysaetos chrysaetos]|uniref:WAS/WASL-interacting protein family member 3-like n=1 Tax=Aquila chrysaetos chrysaetos TaxID=223781 RepID=UPI00117724AA|nr:WAS/WASL-interacting protein family member 3-like [Aquila chrysaetos chrysaetos]
MSLKVAAIPHRHLYKVKTAPLMAPFAPAAQRGGRTFLPPLLRASDREVQQRGESSRISAPSASDSRTARRAPGSRWSAQPRLCASRHRANLPLPPPPPPPPSPPPPPLLAAAVAARRSIAAPRPLIRSDSAGEGEVRGSHRLGAPRRARPGRLPPQPIRGGEEGARGGCPCRLSRPGPPPRRRHAAAWDGRVLIARPGAGTGLQTSGFSAYGITSAGSGGKAGKAEPGQDGTGGRQWAAALYSGTRSLRLI